MRKRLDDLESILHNEKKKPNPFDDLFSWFLAGNTIREGQSILVGRKSGEVDIIESFLRFDKDECIVTQNGKEWSYAKLSTDIKTNFNWLPNFDGVQPEHTKGKKILCKYKDGEIQLNDANVVGWEIENKHDDLLEYCVVDV